MIIYCRHKICRDFCKQSPSSEVPELKKKRKKKKLWAVNKHNKPPFKQKLFIQIRNRAENLSEIKNLFAQSVLIKKGRYISEQTQWNR